MPEVEKKVADTQTELTLLQEARQAKKASGLSDEDSEDEDEKNENDDEAAQLIGLTNTLSSWREVQHRVLFFIASCNHSIKNEDVENEYYQKAAELRSTILNASELTVKKIKGRVVDEKAVLFTDRLKGKMKKWFASRGDLEIFGIVARRSLKSLSDVTKLLDEQWNDALVKWRFRIIELLSTDLEPNEAGNEADREVKASNDTKLDQDGLKKPSGEEYLKGVDIQAELEDLLVCRSLWSFSGY
jgi:E3 ubiquitin-protein ligase SHPRH